MKGCNLMAPKSNILKTNATAMKRVSPLWRRIMQTVDERILLHTNPNRLTICWLSISVMSVIGALFCFLWYAVSIEAKADRAQSVSASVKREAVYLHKVTASNKQRLNKLEGKAK